MSPIGHGLRVQAGQEFLQSEDSTYWRLAARGDANSSEGGGPQGSMSQVRQGESGEVVVVGELLVFHETLGLVYGTPLERNSGQGRGEGTQAELEDREEPG